MTEAQVDFKLLFKEFKNINVDTKGVYESQAQIEFPNGESDPLTLDVLIAPIYGPFRGALIKFRIVLPKDYPNSKPTVKCLTKVFHPNINYEGSVCFSMFSGEWSKDYRLEHFVNGLLWLLSNPNPDSALNGHACVKDQKMYAFKTALTIRGFAIGTTTFNPYINPNLQEQILKEKIESPFAFTLVESFKYIQEKLNKQSFQITELLCPEFQFLEPKEPAQRYFQFLEQRKIVGELIKVSSPHTGRVKDRASASKTPSENVVKELLWSIDGKPVLIITPGREKIDVEQLAKLFNIPADKCCMMKKGEAQTVLEYPFESIPFFGHDNEKILTIFNSVLFDNPDTVFVTASGVPNFLLKIKAKDLKEALPKGSLVEHLQYQKKVDEVLIFTEKQHMDGKEKRSNYWWGSVWAKYPPPLDVEQWHKECNEYVAKLSKNSVNNTNTQETQTTAEVTTTTQTTTQGETTQQTQTTLVEVLTTQITTLNINNNNTTTLVDTPNPVNLLNILRTSQELVVF